MRDSYKARLMKLRKDVRRFLREISGVPMRAVDCDQDAVDRLMARLAQKSGYRGPM